MPAWVVMMPADVEEAWQLLRGLRCRTALHLDRMRPPWTAWGVHLHSVPTVIIALAGCSLLDVDDHRILPLTPGELVLIGPWVNHVNRQPHPGGQTLLLSRTGPWLEVELWRDAGIWYGDLPWTLVGDHIDAWSQAVDDDGRRQAAERVLGALASAKPAQRALPPAVRAMCSFVWRMRTQPITAADVLAASGRSYAVAHELFMGRFGETPKQYLLRTRLDLATRLMLDGASPGEAWREAGFASRADLTRRFRLVHGTAPLAWLRTRRKTRGPAPPRDTGPDAVRREADRS